MKKFIKIIIFIISIFLGYLVNIMAPQFNVEFTTFIGFFFGITISIYGILILLDIICDDTFLDITPIVGLISMAIGTYYYVSEGFEHWVKGLFTMLFLLFEVAIITIPVVIIYMLFDNIKYKMTMSKYKNNGTNTYSSDYYTSDYSNNYSENRSKKSNPIFGGLSTTFFKNGDKATSMDIGGTIKEYSGISKVGELKNSKGEKIGTSTTYDLGFGISKTIYKDKNGKEIDSTTYKW